ncbi:MAG TPA: ATP-binding protein [Gemmataceae bacterium]|nr:ATP-binding protein [Gemmataceae bacterium]
MIEDDEDTRENLRDILELDGYQVEAAGTAAEALGRDNWPQLAAIILDRQLPDGRAEALLPRLKELAPDTAVMIVTGFADLEGAIAALRQGAAEYILKPIDPEVLRGRLGQVVERKRLALAKERSEAAFRSLVEAAPCAILILRPDRGVAYFSPFAEKLTGYRAAEVLGKDCAALLLPDGGARRACEEQLGRLKAGRPILGFEHPIWGKDGTRHWMVWNLKHLPDYEGSPAVLAVGQDITALKEAQERALQQERLAGIGQMMTGLAHESGNALARSQACLEMLALEVPDRPEALDLIGRIQKAQDHLRQLYEEVRGYAAPLKLEREPWDVGAIWRQAWHNLAVQHQGRDAQLHEHINGVDLRCPIDPFRIEQVFRNVFENALAACRDPVRIDVACAETTLAGRPAVRVSVRDNGPGLSPEQRQKIFDPFFTTKTKGTGLGMAIAKRIVDAHGGRIAVGSSAAAADGAQGAEIVLTLPREIP